MEWDDLRYLLALARAKTLAGAARKLGVRHTTVARRIKGLEASLNCHLFDHSFEGYILTEKARQLVAAAEVMEREFVAASRAADAVTDDTVGTVRIGCAEGYGTMVLPRHLAQFQAKNPNTLVDLLTVPRPIHIPKNEADIVITIDRPKPGPYVITKLADYSLRLYGSLGYLEASSPLKNLESLREHRFVSYIDEIAVAKSLPNLIGTLDKRPAIRSTSLISQVEAVRSGAGLAILPCYVGNRHNDLTSVLEREMSFIRTYWMIMPMELKGDRRVRAVWDYLRDAARSEKLTDDRR
ncbi:LysR family transcriptional regulator [Agrobacterium sp. NPDC090273]|uniref:LysR family transcriptional regulator n=1 Tax=Agrobacterium sp. NPDC090273 TaxID=3363919 RepID=UPI00383B52E4